MNRVEQEFYKKCKKDRVMVSVFLINGVRLYGEMGQADDVSIIVKGAENMLVYKHAIMSIVPDGSVEV